MPRTKRIPGKLSGPWPPNVEPGIVSQWASDTMATHMLFWYAAAQKRDIERLESETKNLRSIISRMDAWRRMKLRQWAAEKSAISKQEKTTP